MRPTVFQKAEIRDENDVIVQQGTYGKGSALSNSTNDGWVDYVMNNLEFLYGLAKDEVVPVSALPASGDMNKTYLLTTNGKTYRWSGTAWVELTSSEAVGRAETAANLAEQWATKTDGTVADNEYSAKYYANAAQQSADDAQDVADDMAIHLSQIDQNTGGVSANSKRISNIEKLLQGNLYDYQTDSDSAYTKSVPSGAMPYAGLEKVGGKTVVLNQLLREVSSTYWHNYSDSYTSATYSDGVAEVTILNTNDSNWLRGFLLNSSSRYTAIGGHKYFISADTKTNQASVTFMGEYTQGAVQELGTVANANTWTHLSQIFTCETTIIKSFITYPTTNLEGLVYSIKNTMLFDLTLMYGSGNEPSTVAEFESMFPASYHPYNAGTLLSAGVTEVVSKDSNNSTLQTIPIPSAIRNLEGYGWSAGTAYNYVDFERKVFVQRVGQKTLNGTESWSWNSNNSLAITSVSNGIIIDASTQRNVYVLAGNSQIYNSSWVGRNSNPYSLGIFFGASALFFSDTTITSGADAQAYFTAHPTVVNYVLQNPIETDISAYLTDDNLINVEAGGTLTFPNSNGTDYQIPVPSEETYMIDLQEAINNG